MKSLLVIAAPTNVIVARTLRVIAAPTNVIAAPTNVIAAWRQSPCARKSPTVMIRGMTCGFTLIEVLVAGLILSIGFTALYFWFIGNSTMVKRDRIRVEAFQILESESERLTANPILARDSEWTVVTGIDSFALRSEVLDTTKLRHIADSTGLTTLEANRLVQRPFEVHISLSSISPTPYTTDEFFLVGGVMHVAP